MCRLIRILLDCHYSSLNGTKTIQASNKELGPSLVPPPTLSDILTMTLDVSVNAFIHMQKGVNSIVFKFMKTDGIKYVR